ncbi:MAG: hypothetical protein EBV59_11535, partial [Synechococcaceae bacterium WB7_1C_051]|nr:hypothetical protein [Synechococcaceae bacterium WB7_1C_051]
MDGLLQLLINGISIGATYALFALGYTLVFSVLGVINFAHGAVLMRTIVIPPIWKKGNIPIKDLQLPPGLIAGLIRRGKQILFPHGNDFLLPGDEATLIGEP